MIIEFLIILIIVLGFTSYFFYKIKPKMDPMNKADQFIKQNRFMEAVSEYKRVLYTKPDNINIHYIIADLYLKLNKTEQAIFHLSEIIRIDKYNYEVEQLDVQKKLANAYHLVGNIHDAFQTFINTLSLHPDDAEALYHTSFISLGQEEFEIAQRYFNKLVKLDDSFEIFFGIGICSYQNQKIDNAVKYFKESISIKPNSEIAILAITLALQKTENYKEAITYIKKLANKASSDDVKYISMRLLAFLYIQSKKVDEAIGIMEEMLDLAKKNEAEEEIKLTLYDLGFACVKANKNSKANNYWKELQKLDRDYNNIHDLLDLLFKEMNKPADEMKDDFEIYVSDSTDDWQANAFSPKFLWDICGLKSDKEVDIKNMLVTTKVTKGKDQKAADSSSGDFNERIEKFCNLNTENFKIMSNRLVSKMGFKVDEILPTYREADGVDFLTFGEDGKKVLVWVRRWQDTKVGEITLRNFAQAINDAKASKGLLVTTAELTDGAEKSLKNLSKVTPIYPEEVNNLLKGLIKL